MMRCTLLSALFVCGLATLALATPSEDRPAIGPNDLAVIEKPETVFYLATDHGLLEARPSGSGPLQGTIVALDGVPLTRLHIESVEPLRILVGTGCCGAVRVGKQGGKWVVLSKLNTLGQHVYAIFPQNGGQVVYVSTEKGVLRSDNAGELFKNVNQGIAEGKRVVHFRAIQGGGPVMAFDEQVQCYLWNDEAETWEEYSEKYNILRMTNLRKGDGIEAMLNQKKGPAFEWGVVKFFARGPFRGLERVGDKLFYGSALAGVQVIRERNGLTWESQIIAFKDLPLHAMTAPVGDSTHFFVCLDDGIHKSVDQGQTWEHLGALPLPPTPTPVEPQ